MAQGNIKITKSVVDFLKPGPERFTVWDAELRGFGVRVSPAGRKTYVVQFRIGGRAASAQKLTLGVHGVITPDQARNLARKALGQIADGVDPAAEKRKAKRELATLPTLSELSDDFLELHVRPKLKSRTADEYERMIARYLKPALGKLLVRDLAFADVERFHHTMRATPGQANRMVAVLSKMMTFAIRGGRRPDRQNPCKGIERYKERKKQRFLSEAELARLGVAVREAEVVGVAWTIDTDSPTAKHLPKDAGARRTTIDCHAAAAIRLLVFTGARLNEILTLRWDQVDFDADLLRLPDSKTGQKDIILNAPAKAILAGLPRIHGNPFVIFGAKEGAHRVDLNKPWRIVRKLAGIEGVRIHDLRHTLASHGRAAGVSLSIVGGLLGHKNTATTAGYAHLWDDPMREAASKIGDRMKLLMDGEPAGGADVVPIRKKS